MINEIEYERIKYFFENKIMIHVVKISGEFLNGMVLEYCDKYFILDDRIKGEQFIFFSELKKPIEKYFNKNE